MDALTLIAPIARDNGGVLTRSQVLATGVSARVLSELVSTGSVARIARGVYAVGDPLPEPRRIANGWYAVISYQSAVAWHGVDLPTPLTQIHVTVPRHRGRYAEAVAGVRLHRADLARTDVEFRNGALVTTPLRTCLDIARHAPIDQAVAIIDAFIRQRHFTDAEFAAVARGAKGPGRLRIQTVAGLVDPLSGSVLESLTRVLLWREGLPIPVTQLSLKSSATGWVGFVDFAWPQLRAVLECDGYAYHSSREYFRRDRRRWTAITAAGWRLAVVTWFDVTQDPAYVVTAVRRLLDLGAEANTNVTRAAS
ncbi:MAG TPA: type IV toxin-antitoxin system AbiEi family antitoxin domain-containing protein [Mycobacteriales bacterium]|nr:type IV toxin-antitoxin system AbiEi family antitoxin domain-containing protein [Mycobacteriales bacterium]HWB68092.1 type IV toxin-antitoxin system AbiEi family antitoxin domain-containing protein [Mycobacteriales bacterium]